MKGYDTAAYAKTRLQETMIRLGETPVVVVDCIQDGDKIVVAYKEVVSGKTPVKHDALEKFNLDPVPLGYVNYSRDAIYLSRMPMRKDWRQGLRGINMVNAKGDNMFHLPLPVVVNTVLGKFPTFKSALEELNTKSPKDKPARALAFCRDFAVCANGDLEYKSLFNAGKVDMSNGNINVAANFNWVREALEESLVA